ncbi:MAG: translocation/assembly module TamB domain-containing protein [Bdellovibrionales bacterium]
MPNKNHLIIAALLLVLIAGEHFFHNSISSLIQKEITKEVAKQGLDVDFQKADYGYLPPRLILDTITYKDDTAILSAAKVSLSIKILPLIKGQVQPSSLSIESANISLKIAQSKKSKKGTKAFSIADLKLDETLALLPLDQVHVLNSKVIAFFKGDIVDLDVKKASIQKLYNKLQLEIQSNVTLRTSELKDNFHLNTKVRWQESGFFLNFFTLQKENSIVQLSGSLKDKILTDFSLNTKDIYQDINELRVKLNLDLLEFNDLLMYLTKESIPPKASIRSFAGRVQASAYYYNSEETSDKSILSLQANNLKTPFISLDEISTKGELTDKDFSTESIQIKLSKESSLNINNLKIQRKNKSFLLSSDLKSKFMRVEDVLSSLNLKAGSISIPVSLDTHCGGVIFKDLLLKCNGKGDLIKLDILAPNSPNKIFSVNKISTEFSGTLTKSDFNFTADAKYKAPTSKLESTGNVTGNVNYVTGFDVDFETSPVDLEFVNEISGQKFEGAISLKGNSKGSSKWGEIAADIDSQNLQFNDLFLGGHTALFTYKFPLLTFENIKGEILEGSNPYSGSVTLNVDDNDLLLSLKGENVTDLGIRTLFAKSFNLPDQVKFDSNFTLFAQDGLDINKMSLDFKGTLNNLELFGEHFARGSIKLKGPKGKWDIVEATLNKENSSFKAQGYLLGLKEINSHVRSSSFKLEDSDFLKSLGVSLSGPASITLNAKGPLDGPEAIGEVLLNQTKGPRKNNMGDSSISYRLFENEIYFKGHAFQKALVGEGHYPLTETGRLSYQGEITRLNLLDFLNLNSSNAPDTRMFLWSKPNFSVKNISKNSPKGSIENTRLKLVSETQALLSLNQNQNSSFSKPLHFAIAQESGNTDLSLDFSKRQSKKLTLNGDLSLEFLKPFIPTCELITGNFSAKNLSLASSKQGLYGSGTAAISKTSFKTDSFPYSFNNISSDIGFSKNLMQFKKIKAALANTQLNGDGSIEFKPETSLMSFNLNYKNLNIEFPPKISTRSNGRINLAGYKFPLVLSGDVTVKEGLFAQDVLSTTSTESVTPSKYLPSQILRKSSPPAILDVRVHIKNKMKIQNNEADGFAYGFLKATGNPVDPLLSGNIRLKQGLKISFHDKEFTLNEGNLSYKNKLTTNPDIFIDAFSNIVDSNDPLEKSYSIRMLIKGTASKPDIKFSSQPSLEENQIISLLTIGTISTQSLGQEITSTEQATYSGLQFGSYLMQKNQALKDLQKQTGTQIGLSSSVSSGGVNPKVFVKKSWTKKSSSTLSQTFGNQKSLAFTTEYKLNKKTSTVLGVQNNQTDDASQLINRRVQQGVIFDLGLQYKFEFD